MNERKFKRKRLPILSHSVYEVPEETRTEVTREDYYVNCWGDANFRVYNGEQLLFGTEFTDELEVNALRRSKGEPTRVEDMQEYINLINTNMRQHIPQEYHISFMNFVIGMLRYCAATHVQYDVTHDGYSIVYRGNDTHYTPNTDPRWHSKHEERRKLRGVHAVEEYKHKLVKASEYSPTIQTQNELITALPHNEIQRAVGNILGGLRL